MSNELNFKGLKVDLSPDDRNILESHKDVVDGIALMMGPSCEVVLHSLENPEHACIKIAHSHHTRRSVGASLTDHGVQVIREFLKSGQQHGSCYTTMSANGDPMRSVFTVINNDGRAIGLLGINFNMNTPLSEFISTFSLFNNCQDTSSSSEPKPGAHSIDGLVKNAVSEVVKEISTNINIPNHEKNKYIVFGLHEKGIFDIKGAVIMVATELNLSKFTIYSYIREMRDKTDSKK